MALLRLEYLRADIEKDRKSGKYGPQAGRGLGNPGGITRD
jgi:hypothetical protein